MAFGAKPKFRLCEKPIDDEEGGLDAVIDQFGFPVVADQEQGRKLGPCRRGRHFDIDALAVVEGAQRAPWHSVALKAIAEVQLRRIDILGDRRLKRCTLSSRSA